ncbi:TATA element modulatory factor 1-like protein [Elsinoe fawcettii]|nr:TATA element modulatory factor 1-like protein [Elsinoe fawcettii]
MTSNQQKAKQASRWGSLLSGAVAGLESRLDTILTDDSEASAKSRAADAEVKAALAQAKQDASLQVQAQGVSRSPSKSRPNDRLQERLAKAMAAKSGSQAGSEVSSPRLPATASMDLESPRTSLDSRPSIEVTRPTVPGEEDAPTLKLDQSQDDSAASIAVSNDAPETLLSSSLPINPARHSEDAVPRPESAADDVFAIDASKSSLESDAPRKSPAELEAELIQMRAEKEESDKQKQEDMETVLERIDALQSKLQYLAKETVAAAKEANAQADKGSLEKKLAEKDEKIAMLMEEGQTLSKTEMRQLTNIRKLGAQVLAETKTSAELKKEVSRLKQSESVLKTRLARLEQSEKEQSTKAARATQLESQLASLRYDLSTKENAITALKRRLEDNEKKLEKLEAGLQSTSLVADTRRIGDLEEELSNAKIEKKLVEDRTRSEIQRLKAEVAEQRDRAQSSELEHRTEITNLEARMETLRLRAEEASSDQTGDGQAKLLRQIETLQTQYSLAAENWRTIEGSLNSRLAAIEKERDETAKREGDVRKKARDLGMKVRKLEEERDTDTDKTSGLAIELAERKVLVQKLQARLETSEKTLEEARHDFEQQRQTFEATLSTRIEEERSRRASNSISTHGRSKRTPSPNSIRKTSAADAIISSTFRKPARTNDSSTSLNHFHTSRRPSALPFDINKDYLPSPTSISRKHSQLSLGQLNGSSVQGSYSSLPTPTDLPPTPSIMTEAPDEDFSRHSSPRGTAADVISASTVHTGPSVQLVERMSSSIRRLEAEKAAHRDEVTRLQSQRDEARDEMVRLMREVDSKKDVEKEMRDVRAEMDKLGERYEACLEMLGEREEEVLELRGDLGEMKRIYRDLAAKMGTT